MNPRLSTSKTWTEFPSEFLEHVQDLVADTFEEHLIDGAELHVEGRIYPEEVVFRLGFTREGQLKQNNFEASAQFHPETSDTKQIMNHCIEAAAAMMAEYFDFDGEVDFPQQWTEFRFEGTPLYVQYSTINTELEKQADEWLGELDQNLVHETISDDALDYVEEQLPSPTDEEEEALRAFDEEDDDYGDGEDSFANNSQKDST